MYRWVDVCTDGLMCVQMGFSLLVPQTLAWDNYLMYVRKYCSENLKHEVKRSGSLKTVFSYFITFLFSFAVHLT